MNKVCRIWLLGLLTLLLAVPMGCSSTPDSTDADTAGTEDTGQEQDLLPEDVIPDVPGDLPDEDVFEEDLFEDLFEIQEDTAPDDTQVIEVIEGPSGCVSCHTNKEMVQELAEEEEHQEEEGGGG